MSRFFRLSLMVCVCVESRFTLTALPLETRFNSPRSLCSFFTLSSAKQCEKSNIMIVLKLLKVSCGFRYMFSLTSNIPDNRWLLPRPFSCDILGGACPSLSCPRVFSSAHIHIKGGRLSFLTQVPIRFHLSPIHQTRTFFILVPRNSAPVQLIRSRKISQLRE